MYKRCLHKYWTFDKRTFLRMHIRSKKFTCFCQVSPRSMKTWAHFLTRRKKMGRLNQISGLKVKTDVINLHWEHLWRKYHVIQSFFLQSQHLKHNSYNKNEKENQPWNGCVGAARKVSPDWSQKTNDMSFFQLFQHCLGSGLGTIGDFSS